jgi:RES domain
MYDYLPTQAIAEYLATKVKPSFDGIIFKSPQTGGEGRNVVLFNHSSAVIGSGQPQSSQTGASSRQARYLPASGFVQSAGVGSGRPPRYIAGFERCTLPIECDTLPMLSLLQEQPNKWARSRAAVGPLDPPPRTGG